MARRSPLLIYLGTAVLAGGVAMFSIATLLAQLPSGRSGERPISPRIAASIARQMPIPPQVRTEIAPVPAVVAAPVRMLELSHPVRKKAEYKPRRTVKQKSKQTLAKRLPPHPPTQALGYAASPPTAQEPFSPYVH